MKNTLRPSFVLALGFLILGSLPLTATTLSPSDVHYRVTATLRDPHAVDTSSTSPASDASSNEISR